MPETENHIILDENGVCNCCREYRNNYSVNEEIYGIEELKK